MFRAIRSWWAGGSGKVTLRLFAFEFVVVMFGVLAAQAVAEWVQENNAQRRLDHALERVRRDAGYNMAAALVWQKAAPCLTQRMTQIMRSAAQDTPLRATELVRPRMRFNYFEPLGESDDLLLRNRGGDQLADSIQQLDSSVGVMAQRLRDIADRWTSFDLLDPANGPVMREDRVEARHNASVIRTNLAGVAISANSVVEFGKAVGAKATFDQGERLPRDCAEIWSSSQTMIVGLAN